MALIHSVDGFAGMVSDFDTPPTTPLTPLLTQCPRLASPEGVGACFGTAAFVVLILATIRCFCERVSWKGKKAEDSSDGLLTDLNRADVQRFPAESSGKDVVGHESMEHINEKIQNREAQKVACKLREAQSQAA